MSLRLVRLCLYIAELCLFKHVAGIVDILIEHVAVLPALLRAVERHVRTLIELVEIHAVLREYRDPDTAGGGKPLIGGAYLQRLAVYERQRGNVLHQYHEFIAADAPDNVRAAEG